MTFSREEIAAFADGELAEARSAELAAAMDADPELAAQVSAHHAVRDRLAAHFAPIMAAPLPERLVRPLEQSNGIASMAEARRKGDARGSRNIARWGWIAGPALAASLALALFMPRQEPDGLVHGQLATALDQQLVSAQSPGAPQRILLSFRNRAGEYCRAFTSQDQGGIACREPEGWRLEESRAGADPDKGEYRMAGASSAALLERAQAMAEGPALDATQERAAREGGWR